jgi:hypothetical protein
MSFLPFHLGADARSQGRVGKWIRSWWRTSDQASSPGCDRNWGGLPLVEVTPENMFELKNTKAARLWMLPPAAMKVAIELLWEDKLAQLGLCRTPLDDAHVEEKPGEVSGRTFPRAGGCLILGVVAV